MRMNFFHLLRPQKIYLFNMNISLNLLLKIRSCFCFKLTEIGITFMLSLYCFLLSTTENNPSQCFK